MKDGRISGHESFNVDKMIKIGNAPCSWGALEFDLEEQSEDIGFEQVLDEIKSTGYIGTELGDWGFMPTSPDDLRKELNKRDLELLGAFVPVDLKDKERHQSGVDDALKVAHLMYEAGFKDALIVLADDNGKDPQRTQNAGRISSDMELSDQQWIDYAEGANQIGKAVKETYGIKTVFHHHCGGFIETPNEIDRLMELTDPELVGLCLDTGHCAFGGGNPATMLKKYANRLSHVHFKDFNPKAAENSQKENGDYFDAIKKGVFCELGKGNVDFQAIVNQLNELGYDDWIVVEQDILPGMGHPKICAESNRAYIKTLGL